VVGLGTLKDMRNRRRPGAGARANRAIDDLTADASERAVQVIVMAVRLLRWPTLILLTAPLPFTAGLLLIGVVDDAPVRWFAAIAGIALAAVALLFGLRRARILRAVAEPDRLATELGIAVSMSGKLDDARGALLQIGSANGGARVFSRLRGVWNTAGLGGRWIEGIGDLPRARYFFPPRIGATVTLAIAAAWAAPISFVLFVLVGIAALAN